MMRSPLPNQIEYTCERLGCTLHYWLSGPADAPLVVFTHGATLDHRSFAAQIAPVATHYRTLCWDVRGHGRSQPLGTPFSMATAVADLLAILDQLGVEQATFVGHSMGGAILQDLVFRHPQRVRALVIIGCSCITLPRSRAAMTALRALPLILRLYPYHLYKAQMARSFALRPEVASYAMEAMNQVARQDFMPIWTEVMQCLHPEPGYRIEQPLLVAYGDHDTRRRLFAAQAPIWTARDPASQHVVIPNAGHNAHQDNPEFFNQLLRDFLATHLGK